jgi:hypothetical protein
MQVSHRLKRPQALKAWREHDKQTGGGLEDAIVKET